MTPVDDKAFEDTSRTLGGAQPVYEQFDHWLRRWQELHPDDDRTVVELIDVYWEGRDNATQE